MERWDTWVVLKISSKGFGTTYKVLVDRHNSTVGQDDWRLCSGIKRVQMGENNCVLIYNKSGSVYSVPFDKYEVGTLSASIIDNLRSLSDDAVVTILTLEDTLKRFEK